MKALVGFSMGYSGTATSWEEEIPKDIVEEGKASIEYYLENMQQEAYEMACDKISVWAKIKE